MTRPILDDLRAAATRFATAVAVTDLDLAVPSCPGWTVRDLVGHVGTIHEWATEIVRTREKAPQVDADPGTDPSGWYAGRASRLAAALEAADLDAPCWNFAGVDETVGFWLRRQVHEVRMHLVDLELAAGRGLELDPDLSTDGVAETLSVFLPRLHARGFPVDLTAPVSLLATDTGRCWTLVPRDGQWPEVREDRDAPESLGPVEPRLEGTAAALLLLLWKRADEGVRRVGDAEVLNRFLGSRLTA